MTWGFQISNPKPLKTRITPYLMMLPAWFHCISSILVVQNAHLWISPTLLCLALLLHRKVIAESKKSHRGCKYTVSSCPINFVDANNFQLHEEFVEKWDKLSGWILEGSSGITVGSLLKYYPGVDNLLGAEHWSSLGDCLRILDINSAWWAWSFFFDLADKPSGWSGISRSD